MVVVGYTALPSPTIPLMGSSYRHPLGVIRYASYGLAVGVVWLMFVGFRQLTDLVRFR